MTANKLPKRSKKEEWPIVRKSKHKNGAEAWMVDGRVRGKGPRTFHVTKVEANTVAEQLRIQRKNEGLSAFTMSHIDRADASAALEQLTPYGATLREAARFFAAHHKIAQCNVTLSDAIDEYMAVRQADGIARHTFVHTRAFYRRFLREFPTHKLSDFSTHLLNDYLRSLNSRLSGRSRNQVRRTLHGIFSFAVKREYLLKNPVTGTALAKVEDKPPGILTVSQTARLLAASEDNIRACLALGLFAGLRPLSEVLRLDWSDINFETGYINVRADRTKTARHRLVKMSDNLVEWLLPLRRLGGLVGPCEMTYCARSIATREKAGIKEWPKDVLRHTFGSMFYAHTQSAEKTAYAMGHKTTDMLFEHYRERVTPEDAALFWEIRPARGQTILSMPERRTQARVPVPTKWPAEQSTIIQLPATA